MCRWWGGAVGAAVARSGRVQRRPVVSSCSVRTAVTRVASSPFAFEPVFKHHKIAARPLEGMFALHSPAELVAPHEQTISCTTACRAALSSIVGCGSFTLFLPVASRNGRIIAVYMFATDDPDAASAEPVLHILPHSPLRPKNPLLEALTSGQCRLVAGAGSLTSLLLPVFGSDGRPAVLFRMDCVELPPSSRRSTPSPPLVAQLRSAVSCTGLLELLSHDSFVHPGAVTQALCEHLSDVATRAWVPDEEAPDCAVCENRANRRASNRRLSPLPCCLFPPS